MALIATPVRVLATSSGVRALPVGTRKYGRVLLIPGKPLDRAIPRFFWR